MSINDATPEDWDRLRETYFEEAKQELEEDMVGAPKHYNTGSIECIDAIKESMSSAEFRGYLKGNCLKYLWRYAYKGKPVEDLQKAQWYLDTLLIAMLKEEEEDNEY